MNASPDCKLPTVPEWNPYKKAEEPYLRRFVSKRREMPKPVPTKAFLWPANRKAAAMCMGLCAETRPPPPIPPFLLVQNQLSKRIAPTDNMQSKLHDKYTRHQWLKGLVVLQERCITEGITDFSIQTDQCTLQLRS